MIQTRHAESLTREMVCRPEGQLATERVEVHFMTPKLGQKRPRRGHRGSTYTPQEMTRVLS